MLIIRKYFKAAAILVLFVILSSNYYKKNQFIFGDFDLSLYQIMEENVLFFEGDWHRCFS